MSTRLEICPNCLRSVVVQDTDLRLAVADDTVALTPEDLAKLREERKAFRAVKTATEIPPLEPIADSGV